WMLMNALQQAGVIKAAQEPETPKRLVVQFSVGAVLITALLTLFLRSALQGPVTVSIGGAVQAPYEFPVEHGDIGEIEAESALRGAAMLYKGFPVKDLIAAAQPASDQGWILVQGSDGYAFFIPRSEIQGNASLLLVSQGDGEKRSYNLVGAKNSKAWVRGVQALLVVSPPTLEITGLLDNPGIYDPEAWQFEMDSTFLTIGEISGKFQGAPLGPVLQDLGIQPQAQEVVLIGAEKPVSFDLSKIMADQDFRIFTMIVGEQVSYALARMDGQVIVSDLERIELR
ncbi:MAG: hypothetical protein MIO92_12660, partial [Methanosarcinaceae archaeon]|nr:hypothetical protein [Methanosarcinaceae archaeon]